MTDVSEREFLITDSSYCPSDGSARLLREQEETFPQLNYQDLFISNK